MDFSKLNIEFANMQSIIEKYNVLVLEINQKIKFIDKEISKYDTKIKNTKNEIEKELYKIIVIKLNEEKKYLKSLIKESVNNEKQSNNL